MPKSATHTDDDAEKPLTFVNWPDAYRDWLHRGGHGQPPSLDGLSAFQRSRAGLILAIGSLVRQPSIGECDAKDLRKVVGVDHKGMPEGFFRTIERWLRRIPKALKGKIRENGIAPPVNVGSFRTITRPLLLVEQNGEARAGLPAILTLESLPGSDPVKGTLFPHREMALIETDEDWDLALKRALRSNAAVWPAKDGRPVEVRWHVRVQRSAAQPLGVLTGGSAGAAFQRALSDLCEENDDPQLSGIAATAELAEDFSWKPVGDLLEKLVGAARDAFPAVHTVMVAAEQNLDGVRGRMKSVGSGANGYLIDASEGFRQLAIVTAGSADDSRTRALVPARNRWTLGTAPDIAELPARPYEVHRDRFIREIETRIEAMNRGFLLVIGEMGRGKTFAMSQLVRAWRRDGRDPVCYFLPKAGVNARTPDEIANHLYHQLCLKHAFAEPADWSVRFKNSPAARLEEFLRQLSEHLKITGRREILVVEAADQAVLEQGRDMIPSVLREPPERVVWLVSSRPRTSPTISDRVPVQTVDFLSVVDEREDARNFLEARGAALRPPLSPALIDQICDPLQAPPVMFTLDWALSNLETPREDADAKRIGESLRHDPELWRREPRLLVYDDLLRVLDDAAKAGVPQRETRQLLLLPALAGEPLSVDLLADLGISSPHSDEVFKLAANFFEDYPSLSLRHAGYARAIRGEEIPEEFRRAMGTLRVRPDELQAAHRALAEACRCGLRKEVESEAGGFAVRNACAHLREARMGAEWAALLLEEPEFLAKRLAASGAAELLRDFPAGPHAAEAAGVPAEVSPSIEKLRRVLESRSHFITTRLREMEAEQA